MARNRAYPTELYLTTTLLRQDNAGEPVEVDAIVYFEARMTDPGYRGSYYQPPEAPEYAITFNSADLDGIPHDAPGPITTLETETLRAWFARHRSEATECANDNYMGEY